jgi:hypothetical protein
MDQINAFLAGDSRFRRGKGPEEVAKGERERGHRRSRIDTAHIAFTEKALFERPFRTAALNRLSSDGKSFEMGLGWWVVRIEDTRKLTSSKVPEWEIEIQIGYEVRLVYPSVVREIVTRNTNVETYEKWKAEVLSTESDLRRLLTEACSRMRQPMAASWITSQSSERLLKRMGIPMEREWAFLFQGMTFE